MRLPPLLLLGLSITLNTATLRAGETVTVGGAVVPVATDWTATAQDGTVILSPPDLPQGVVCTFTLLGGEPFTGSLTDRLTAEWKEFERLGRMRDDDGGKVAGGGGAIVTASRSGVVEVKPGVTITVWLLVTSANGRVERMVFVTTAPETFAKYGPAVGGMINGTTYVEPKRGTGIKLGADDVGTFGRMGYTAPAGWRERRAGGAVVLSPGDAPRGELLEVVLLPARTFADTLAASLDRSWDDAAEQSRLAKTRTVNGAAYTTPGQRTSFKGWDYIRADGVMASTPGANDYAANLTVIRIGDRVERVLVRAKQNRLNVRSYNLYQAPEYHQAIQAFLFALRFDDWKEPEVRPGTLDGDGVTGVWSGSAMFGRTLHTAYAIFFSNGQVFLGPRFPFRGCHEFDTWVDAEEVPQYWGTYEFKDGKGSLSLKMPSRVIPIRTNGDELAFTSQNADQRFLRLPPVDGARFDGTYAFHKRDDKVPTIHFTPDGRFDDRGALDVLRLEGTYPFSPTAEPGGGTYAFKDYTLLLDYTDNRKYRIAFPGLWGYDRKILSPDLLRLGHGDHELRKL